MRKLWVVVGIVAVLGFMAFVYPTRYRIESGAINGRNVTMRIDRFNGRIEVATPNGWTAATPSTPGLSDKTKAILEGR